MNTVRLRHGTLDLVLWCGDFNARIGQRLYSSAADTTTNTRGLQLLDSMAHYTLLPSTPSCTDSFTYTHNNNTGSYSTLDYIWIEHPPDPLPYTVVNTEPWSDLFNPSDHAILSASFSIPLYTSPPLVPTSQLPSQAPAPRRLTLTTAELLSFRKWDWSHASTALSRAVERQEPVTSLQLLLESEVHAALCSALHCPTLNVHRRPPTHSPNPNKTLKVIRPWYTS